MKILTTNLFLNSNKIYFSKIQNNMINFAGKNLSKKQRESLIQKIKENAENGGSIKDFCKKYNISHQMYHIYIKKLNFSPEEIKLNRQRNKIKNQSNLYEAILENYKNGGSIKDFCKEYGIHSVTYIKKLKEIESDLTKIRTERGKNQKKLLSEQQKELYEKIKQAYINGEPIEKICEENNVCSATLFNTIRAFAKNKKEIRELRENALEKQLQELDEQIIKNHKEGKDVSEFCRRKNISAFTYRQRLKKSGILPAESPIMPRRNNNELNKKIIENHNKGGNIRNFCEKYNISIPTYYNHLINLGLHKKKRTQEDMLFLQEIEQAILSGEKPTEFLRKKGYTKQQITNTFLKYRQELKVIKQKMRRQ